MNTRTSPPNTRELPSSYRMHESVDLKENGKVAVLIQVISVLVAVAMMGLAVVQDLALASGWSSAVTVAVTLFSCVVYMAAHELTHGAFLWALTGARPQFSVRLPYLTTGNEAYLNKRSFVVVALAPLLVWGVVFVLLLLLAPQDLLLTTYVLLVLNLASSAGDVVQAIAAARFPAAALIRDNGHDTTVYLAHT
ncbi:DUF3267 domain-containing protein [Ornithinimicrobium sp. LYQ92]|uniref:DUF3267 domain-containing protein n=1 Tax=Serinicoccus sp. LYQ92 TaxID=3378798 RepID=UPI0038522AE2